MTRLSTALRPLNGAPHWRKALEEAQLDGEKKPLPLEVFKVSGCNTRWFVSPGGGA